jgi:hypothetical protein
MQVCVAGALAGWLAGGLLRRLGWRYTAVSVVACLRYLLVLGTLRYLWLVLTLGLVASPNEATGTFSYQELWGYLHHCPTWGLSPWYSLARTLEDLCSR